MGKPSRPAGTRPGFPELWGVGELLAYAATTAERRGKRPPKAAQAWSWDRISDFPAPVAVLDMGYVYLAREVRPWVDAFIDRQPEHPHSTERIPDDVRRAILAEKGKGSVRKTAAKFGVGSSTVQRIWKGEP